MIKSWQNVSLGEVALPIERPEVPIAGTPFRQIGVKLWGEGAYERENIDGSQTKYKTLSKVRTDDIIVNKIWARNGSVAVVPEKLSGCYASSEFPLFSPNKEKIEPRWFHWITKTKFFWEQCDEKSQGTSGKNRIRPEQFLSVEIPLPPLPEQQRIVARIEELAAKVDEAKGLREKAVDKAEGMIDASLSRVFDHSYLSVEPIPISQTDLKLNEETKNPSSDSPNEKFFYVDISGVESGTGKISQVKELFGYEAPSRARRVLKENNIIMSTVRPNLKAIAKVPLTLDGHICSTGFAVFSCPENILPNFMFYQLFSPSFVDQCIATTTGGHYPAVNDTNLRKVKVFVPSLPIQHRIVSCLDNLQSKIDELKKLQSETQKELNALMPSILDKAFKGEL